MSSRRRYLLETIANAYKWLKYYYSYLFYDLVPEKIATFNKWDEEWELGGFNIDGTKDTTTNKIRSKKLIRVIGGQDYYFLNKSSVGYMTIYQYDEIGTFIGYIGSSSESYKQFTTATNCSFIAFQMSPAYGTTYNHDICINESDTQMNGIYAPYQPRKVKDKTRLGTIYGNGMVVNQLAQNLVENFVSSDSAPKIISSNLSFIASHKYLFLVEQNVALSSVVRN